MAASMASHGGFYVCFDSAHFRMESSVSVHSTERLAVRTWPLACQCCPFKCSCWCLPNRFRSSSKTSFCR